jgi:hypothetical protein
MVAVMDTAQPLSDTAVDDYIRSWRIARLSKDSSVGWGSCSIFGRLVDMGPYAAAIGRVFGSRPPLRDSMMSTFDKDAMIVQRIVHSMCDEIRGPFEAFHIGVIRGASCRGQPHKARALILGLERSTYYDRVQLGRRILSIRISEYIDTSDT